MLNDLSKIKNGCSVKGLEDGQICKVINVDWMGDQAAEIFYETQDGVTHKKLIYKDDDIKIEIVKEGNLWSFTADADKMKLLTESLRIKYAYYFDPYLSIYTSSIDPLPHQITAVYEEMLKRHPLKFLLADDPGAGKTIMAGLFIKELIIRGSLKRCLVVVPGNLTEQWQDELNEKFNLKFNIFNTSLLDSFDNFFNDSPMILARMDALARNEDSLNLLKSADDFDLVIVDEAHRMSATYFGQDVNYTRRYRLGQSLSNLAKNFLLMSATPHNGKEEDFQLFMSLLDGDRFEGKYREGGHITDSKDMMRRLTKEELLKFDGTPLFPDRKAYTIKYNLSPMEASLYEAVTDYVKNEWDKVKQKEDGKKKNNIGFALQILQRRLASSPRAIYTSLKRRYERLNDQLKIARLSGQFKQDETKDFSDDLEDLPQDEIDDIEEDISSGLSNAATIEELEAEVAILKSLADEALRLVNSETDTKWVELSKILDDDLMTDENGLRRKLIIFSEAKDTLFYLQEKITARLGNPNMIALIHGGILREERKKIVKKFMQDKELTVIIANDAAGEGVNLQRGNLMVNYDLPWNPNKIEQRFGRIHRIGQTEVCHLWNLVADGTREGDVYSRLLEKLENARVALHGKVYDVLGQLFNQVSLRQLLWEAIEYNSREEVKKKLFTKIDGAIDHKRIKEIIDNNKLTDDVLNELNIQKVKKDMEKAEANRLQPFHVQGFFIEAFKFLGGKIREADNGRFEITHVPSSIIEQSRIIGAKELIQKKYQRICFDKNLKNIQPVAEFIYPGSSLMESIISIFMHKYSYMLKEGSVMIDENDLSNNLRVLFLLEHHIQDGRKHRNGNNFIISHKIQFISFDEDKRILSSGIAPHLDLRKASDIETEFIKKKLPDETWLSSEIENEIKKFAIKEIIPEHLKEIKERRSKDISKIEHEIKTRLQSEMNFWWNRANEIKDSERQGKTGKISSEKAKKRADEIANRLKKRLSEIEKEKKITSSSPNILSGILVIPKGMLIENNIGEADSYTVSIEQKKITEKIAMESIIDVEKKLGNHPEDVSNQNLGYDILSYSEKDDAYRFIEVKGRTIEADTITVTRNEIITALNKREKYFLAIVQIGGEKKITNYICDPFTKEIDFGVQSLNINIKDILKKATEIKY